MNRVDINNLSNVYKKIGMKPIQKEYFTENIDKCCAYTALYLAEGRLIGDRWGREIDDFAFEKTSRDYTISFMDGFDGELNYDPSKERVLGHDDGKAAWEAVKHLALEEVLV